MQRAAFNPSGSNIEISAPEVRASIDLRGSMSGLGGADRDATPIVRIEPDYPPRAQQRGIEGWVVVQFTITTSGTVKDAAVVEAQPQGIFDQAAIKAVSRWKYNPPVEEGTPVERKGVRIMLSFKMEK